MELAKTIERALADGRDVEVTTVRITGARPGGGPGPGLAKRRAVIDTTGVEVRGGRGRMLSVADVVPLRPAARRVG